MRLVVKGVLTPFASTGRVQVASSVLSWAKPVTEFCVTTPFHTSLGDKNSVRSIRLSALAAPRKRSLTALPFKLSALLRVMTVALPFCTLK